MTMYITNNWKIIISIFQYELDKDGVIVNEFNSQTVKSEFDYQWVSYMSSLVVQLRQT